MLICTCIFHELLDISLSNLVDRYHQINIPYILYCFSAFYIRYYTPFTISYELFIVKNVIIFNCYFHLING